MLIDNETYAPGKQADTAEAPLRQLKPSEAMRIGAALRPQGKIFPWTSNGRSCAIGAWWDGMGYGPFQPTGPDGWDAVYMRWHREVGIEPREVYCRNDGTEGFLPHTREAIADWLEAQGL